MRASLIFAAMTVGVLTSLLATVAVRGQNIIEQLVNPGPLATAHAKLEANCNSCHTPFSRQTQNSLCLDCHKPVATDLAVHSGFHGLNPQVASSQCRRCHTDHKGRDGDILFFDAPLFDHALSVFALKGAHVGLACVSCHVAKAKFREAPVACKACHTKDDPHKGELGPSCEACHTADNWRKAAAFDHRKTALPLTGAHAQAECRSCHAGAQYTGLSTTCVGCHEADDIHRGMFGAKCQDCHSAEAWNQVQFDHDRTKFPLRAAHRKVSCDGCHSADPAKDNLPVICIGCHRKDDIHKGSFGPNCVSCHSETAWAQASNFDHDKTSFPLIGSHRSVACADCHKSNDFKAAPRFCQHCHHDTFHKGRLGPDCASCHSPNGWLHWHFDHAARTRFPLTGAHAGLDCHACHSQSVTGRPVLDALCVACHRKDDVHRGAFGQNCERCHSTNTFRR